jgi:hypothetical protein
MVVATRAKDDEETGVLLRGEGGGASYGGAQLSPGGETQLSLGDVIARQEANRRNSSSRMWRVFGVCAASLLLVCVGMLSVDGVRDGDGDGGGDELPPLPRLQGSLRDPARAHPNAEALKAGLCTSRVLCKSSSVQAELSQTHSLQAPRYQ